MLLIRCICWLLMIWSGTRDGEEIRVYTFTLDEALAIIREDFRCDPEAALALWLYARSNG